MFYLNDFLLDKNDYSTYSTENGMILSVDLPGFKKSEVKVKISKRLLSIEAENDKKGNIQKRFTLPTSVDASSVASRLEDGVLTVTMQYKPEMAEKTIDVL